jgi:hypothetical protein
VPLVLRQRMSLPVNDLARLLVGHDLLVGVRVLSKTRVSRLGRPVLRCTPCMSQGVGTVRYVRLDLG